MSSSIVKTLEELGYVRNDELKAELSAMSVRQLIVNFILPKVVEVGGQYTRGWRLSPPFMKLMTEHAQTFISEDRELGELLFELAMQRIQRHDSLPAINYVGILPKEYQQYSAACDQPGLWGDEEWAFMRERLVDGRQLDNDKYWEHCKTLILQILERVFPDGNNSWFGMRTHVSNRELFNWACSAALNFYTLDELVEHLVVKEGPWRVHIAFLAKYKEALDWEKFFSFLDLEAETYYTGVKRGVLKLLGLYKARTKERIKEEIYHADWGE